MAFDRKKRVYVPIMYILMTYKSEHIQLCAIHWLVVASNWNLDPSTVTANFERALQNSLKNQFPGAKMNGCLFHFKQALRCNMVDLCIDSEQIDKTMAWNFLELLTILTHNEIDITGIL